LFSINGTFRRKANRAVRRPQRSRRALLYAEKRSDGEKAPPDSAGQLRLGAGALLLPELSIFFTRSFLSYFVKNLTKANFHQIHYTKREGDLSREKAE
jgi:hypothetical protein